MKKLDRILNNLEKAISTFGLALLGMISYAFVNAENLAPIKVSFLAFGIVSAYTLIVVLCRLYVTHLNQIKED